MKQFILSSSSLHDLLEEPVNFFSNYDVDLLALLACGFTILSTEQPAVATAHLVDDLRASGRLQTAGDEACRMLSITADLLGSYVNQIAGQVTPYVELLRFVGSDPVIGLKPHQNVNP